MNTDKKEIQKRTVIAVMQIKICVSMKNDLPNV